MSSDDEGFVAFLRRFHPRPAGPLLAARPRRARFWFSAAAAGLLGVAGATWLSERSTTDPAAPPAVVESSGPPVERPGQLAVQLGEAARIVEWDATRLDRLLTDLSPQVLPTVEQPGSALQVLAKP